MTQVADEPAVFSLRPPSWRKIVLLVVMMLGAVAWIATSGSIGGIVIGAVGLVCFAWVAAVTLAGRRSSREVVVSRQGIRTAGWSIAWGGVADVSLHQRYLGETIVIEPVRNEDVELAPSRIVAINARINRRFQAPQLVLPQKVVEQPLADVLRAMEEKSGRTFDRATLEPST